AEDAAVGAGEPVPAPVAGEEVALIFLWKGGGVVAQELGVGAAVNLLARRGERMSAREPFIADAGPAGAIVIDPFEYTDETIGVAFAVGEEPELAERIVLEGVGDAQAVDKALHLGAVGVHAHDEAGVPSRGHLAVWPFDLDVVIADAHVELAVGAPFEDKHAKRVPGLVLVGQERLAIDGDALSLLAFLGGLFKEVVLIQMVARGEPELVALHSDAHD